MSIKTKQSDPEAPLEKEKSVASDVIKSVLGSESLFFYPLLLLMLMLDLCCLPSSSWFSSTVLLGDHSHAVHQPGTRSVTLSLPNFVFLDSKMKA